VGGVVGLAGIALGVWFCLRRRKRGGEEMGWKAGGKRSGVDRKASIFSVGAEGKEGTGLGLGLGLGLTGAGTGTGAGGGTMMDPGAGSPFLASPGFGTQALPWTPPAQQKLYVSTSTPPESLLHLISRLSPSNLPGPERPLDLPNLLYSHTALPRSPLPATVPEYATAIYGEHGPFVA
jgi:hypothetical protein